MRLPRVRVLLAFPALLLLLGVVLTALSINGSSSGAMRALVERSADPDLIAGTPAGIRSDEWNVQTVWAIAQVEQGLPVTNRTFPGGMDATVPQDLPRADWSVAFRPHLLGFNILDVDRAIAWKWWLPGLALMAAAYCFMVTVMPKRLFTAVALSIGFFFSPLFQWWYLPTTLWPVVWGFATMTAICWSYASPRRRGAWIWAAVVGYLTVVMAMGIYVPYIMPVVLVVALFAAGAIVSKLRDRGWREAIGGALPVLAAGAAGTAIVGLWLYEKRETVSAFLGTAYPGDRLTPTGAAEPIGSVLAVSSSFTQTLRAGGLLDQNPSEASTVFFIGAFLVPVVVVIVVRCTRSSRRLPWEQIAFTSAIAVFLCFLYVPGWDAVAHALFLDRMTENRLRIGVALASIGLVPYIVRHWESSRSAAPRTVAWAIAGLFLISQVGVAVVLLRLEPESLAAADRWWIYALLAAASLYLFARARPAIAGALFLIVAVLGSYNVNPLYRGVYDLRETDVSRAVRSIDAVSDATWVGVGGRLPTAVLLESGVEAFNGFQGAPSDEMWDEIDPDGEYEYQWNRLAGVSWQFADGDPAVVNPFADQIVVTLDPCDEFAQQNVDFVLADTPPADPSCLTIRDSFATATGELTLYEVD